MKLFAPPGFDAVARALVAAVPSLRREAFTPGRFANGELYVELAGPVEGAECVVLGTLRPPERLLAEYTLLCDTLRRHGARSVLALLPYYAYARQDRLEPDRSLGAAWVGQLLAVSGATTALTLDIHSSEASALCPIPLTSLDPAALFVPALKDLLGADLTLVAPDEGALERGQRLRERAGIERFAHFKKVRARTGVTSELVGTVSERALVFDDILDTGGTLIACVQGLRAAGTRRVAVAVTHGLFTGSDWQQLWDLEVDTIFCTDSVGGPAPPDPRVKVLSCAPALAPALRTFTEASHAQP